MSTTTRPVRWGILGTARITRRLIPAIQTLHAEGQAELIGLASRSPERARAWAQGFGEIRTFDSYQSLLDCPEIDAVYIPLPPSLHHQWTIAAAEAGKHVLCEKPLAINQSQANEMAAACRERRLQLMDGVMWWHTPRAHDLQDELDRGSIGNIRRITSAFSFVADQFPPEDLRFHKELGGGCLGDLGWYCVGASLWSMGRLPDEVWGWSSKTAAAERAFSGWLRAGDMTAGFDCGFEIANRRWLEIAGTAGSLICDDFTRPWNEQKPRYWRHDHAGKAAEHVSVPALQEVCLVREFGRLVQSGQPDHRWGEVALATQAILDALRQSAVTGRAVPVEANSLTSIGGFRGFPRAKPV